ncbi:MAG: glycosyltransferase family 4 protein, partial [Desulfobacterales bacterium]|nr:glycosyltransferase family 4 protein [Desulfobacterales bacterium]
TSSDLKGFSKFIRLAAMMFMGASLAYIARKRGWRHIHVHSCADAANIAMFSSILSGISYSLTLHGGLKDYGPNQKNKWLHASFGVIITKKLKMELESSLAGFLPKYLPTAPMGVDLKTFNRSQPYASWSGTGIFNIFSCGRLNPCKGHDDAIKALAMVREQGINAHLTIAGQDDTSGFKYKKNLVSLISELKLNDYVHLLGAVSEDIIRQKLEESHAFVLASINEPLGVAIMEAMAMNLPVIATREGGVTELVVHNINGLLVDVHSPEQIASNFAMLAHDPALAKRLGEGGYKTVSDHFHSGVSASVIFDGVNRVLKKRI